ncbi:MAG: NYN domain-containing protein [Aristaeellaceae bacterium]
MKPLLIIDGYNVIGAWREAEKERWSIDECRDRLLRLLEDYSGYSGEDVVLVFDGYQSDRKIRTEEQFGNLTLVYTRHGETADSYIERLVAQTPRYRAVRVATSDGLEQSQVLSTGATRLTSRELLRELRHLRQRGMEQHRTVSATPKASLASRLPEDTRRALEAMRRGK